MFVWSKLSAAKWSDAWEERFAGVTDVNLVISSFPGRETVRVEGYCSTQRRALAIQKEWGGSVRELSPGVVGAAGHAFRKRTKFLATTRMRAQASGPYAA